MRLFFSSIVVFLTTMGAIARADAPPVSYFHDVRPLLASQCVACHKPDKTKGELDMTTFGSLLKGGKHGSSVVPGDPDKSKLIEMISGDDPEMPKDADPLKTEQVDLVTRWVKEGAKDDTPAPGTTHVDPPVYAAAPVITSLAFSPDGSLLAVSGYHEILLHKSDGSGLIARLTGESPRIESIVFSHDGKMLGACGGAPADFGQVQIWDPLTHKNLKTFQPSTDSLYGLSFSPDNKTVACAAADKIVRRINIEDGKVLMEFRGHADWVLHTAFTLDGKQMISGGRDKAIKLIDSADGRFEDDINNPLEQIVSMARHPKEEQVLYGGDMGTPRVYRISVNTGRTAGRFDSNLVRQFERQPGPCTAVAWSPDGTQIAAGSVGEVRVYDAVNPDPNAPKSTIDPRAPFDPNKPPPQVHDSKRLLTLTGNIGPIYAIAWKPDGSVIATGGFDGAVRLFDAKTGNLLKQFIPVPIGPVPVDATAPDTRPTTAAAD
jgi:WD40 repeat protein/mono/diheme cytochrome c family protein